MKFKLFGRKQEVRKKTSQVINTHLVYDALVNGLKKMDRQGVDRVVLTMYESEPNQNVRGRWINFGEETRYYPFEMLDETEQGMIRDEKTYTIVSLVRKSVGDIVRYGDRGVSVYHRTHIVPMLPKLKLESELNYITEGGVHMGEKIRQFAESALGNGWNSESIEQRVRDGIEEYHQVTRRLMEGAGVYDALGRMEQRKNTLFEQMMITDNSRFVKVA